MIYIFSIHTWEAIMNVKSMLLGFLIRGSMTGYELKKVFSISFSFFSGLSYGSIYPALKKMEQEGLITMQLQIQNGAPNRKIYTITDAGRKAFIEALRAPFSFERTKSSFLTKLFFFAYLSPEERIAAVTKHLESIKEVHRELEAARPEIKAHADRYQYLCFEFGLRFFDALTRNVSEVLRALEGENTEVTT
jgi:DNA-binding PadR family transcriptional regulator